MMIYWGLKLQSYYLFSLCPTDKVDKVEFDTKFITRHNLPQNIIKIKIKMDRKRKINKTMYNKMEYFNTTSFYLIE